MKGKILQVAEFPHVYESTELLRETISSEAFAIHRLLLNLLYHLKHSEPKRKSGISRAIDQYTERMEILFPKCFPEIQHRIRSEFTRELEELRQ